MWIAFLPTRPQSHLWGHIKSMQYSAHQLLTRSCRFHSSSLQTGSVLKLKYYMYIFYLNSLWNNSQKITLQRMQVLWENNGNISLNQWKHCWRNLFLWKLGNHITAACFFSTWGRVWVHHLSSSSGHRRMPFRRWPFLFISQCLYLRSIYT